MQPGLVGGLATGFSVLVGFIVFLAFESYDQSRSGAEQEALIVVQQLEGAQFFPGRPWARSRESWCATGDRLSTASGTGCALERRATRSTHGASSCFGLCSPFTPETATQQSAYDKWLDQTSTREEARRDRVHGAAGVIPTTLWIVLFFVAAVIFAFTLFFADRGERAVVQAMLIGSVVSVMAVLMLLLYGLEQPVPLGRRRTGARSRWSDRCGSSTRSWA